MIVLDYRDSRPLYQQVKDSLRRMMLTGLLAPGEKLPSVRALATQLAINPNTIQRAYGELETEGYVYSVSGRGSFVAGTDSGQAQRIRGLTEQLKPLLEQSGFENVTCTEAEFEFAGQTHTGIDITATVQGMTVYERQVYLMADSCMYVVTATAYEENGSQAMLDTFTALN